MENQSLRFKSKNLEISHREMDVMACAWIKSAWVGYEKISPVELAIMAGAENNPNICLDIILVVCSITNNEKLLKLLGVGPLQSLINGCGPQLHARIYSESESNSNFAGALAWCILPKNMEKQLGAAHNKQ